MRRILIGIDIGSTTTKIVGLDEDTRELLFSDYARHHTSQVYSVIRGWKLFLKEFPQAVVRAAFTGSGARTIAEKLNMPFVQEVVADSLYLSEYYPGVRTAIELGGQDAKVIFFRKGADGAPEVSDMRMNGSCAGGTGAFIDEIATLLNVPVEEFNCCAEKGRTVYDISGRCGVYAKTDIQPLLNQGALKEDIALSSFHAIAKQTIGGLAQGLEIEKPVAFMGGPLNFHNKLVDVFAQRLSLGKEDVVRPANGELLAAFGAALSLTSMYRDRQETYTASAFLEHLQALMRNTGRDTTEHGQLFFETEEERRAFEARHGTAAREATPKELIAKGVTTKGATAKGIRQDAGDVGKKTDTDGKNLKVYLGMDCGSTTTKFVLLDEEENLVDSFYASNEGNPLSVAKAALLDMHKKYEDQGVELSILASASTGYGEMLLHKAFSTDYHMVETVAHARAALKYVEDVTFLLDIGGQDMKAIWLDNGVITNILVNEACSSGCGSFLESFAATLKIPVGEIAEKAFSSRNPARLGSRCTVFMNSSIITEQRNGRKSEDIMAGLCRSIIENVFTKVIRISNLDSLGDKIMVQGGTFCNDAVLRAMEQYVGREVIRAPYPGLMGAIGAALTARERSKEEAADWGSGFISWEDLKSFTYTQQSNVPCPFCGNHCNRAILTFPNGKSHVTNNRCENGEILGSPKDLAVREQLAENRKKKEEVPNLFAVREKLLFPKDMTKTDPELVKADRGQVIGIPRVLFFWDTMPFWATFWKTLGYRVQLSGKSTRKMYEEGLSAVVSDTVCFPAKLVHGHIRDLVAKGVDRIFMPSICSVPTENTQKTSESMCAVVKGYPLVLHNSDNPEKKWGVPFDAPMFHWCSDRDRNAQIESYMEVTFQIPAAETLQAINAGDRAQAAWKEKLRAEGAAVLESLEGTDRYAVVLASRPYQNDELVNHRLPELFAEMGIPVLTVDSLPGIEEVDLSESRLDVVNNFHARMLASAIMAAQNPHLEYVQIVSFGCGHDAYLSDEIVRLMKEVSGKTPLILKVDESDIQGPLRIRVRSFIETVNMRRKEKNTGSVQALQDPYQVKFTREDKATKTVLVPNTSHAFSEVMAAALSRQGMETVALEIGREEAIRLGKQYVHNDICFPAQIVIGEALAALKSGKYDPDHVAIAMGKYIGDCRLTHYTALLRKALDDAGFPQVPILTNDDVDYHNIHPGYKMNTMSALCIAMALPMIDVLEELLRKIRPYEKVAGSAKSAFDESLALVTDGLRKNGVFGAISGFRKAMQVMCAVEYDRSTLRPTVLIVGEYLLNFHPGANHEIEAYLEENGFEIIEARMTDVIRKSYYVRDRQNREFHLHKSLKEKEWYHIEDKAFDYAHAITDQIASCHPLYEPASRITDLAKESDEVIYHTFDAGEGILIPGEIIHHAKNGCKAFVILQPFGCLPNHVVGRGVVKKLKEMFPDVQILPLDYDPDVSFANIENRLQMLVMKQRKENPAGRTQETENNSSRDGEERTEGEQYLGLASS